MKVLYLLPVEQGFDDGIISTSTSSVFLKEKYEWLSQHQHPLILGLSLPLYTIHKVTEIKALARNACKAHWKKNPPSRDLTGFGIRLKAFHFN